MVDARDVAVHLYGLHAVSRCTGFILIYLKGFNLKAAKKGPGSESRLLTGKRISLSALVSTVSRSGEVT